MTERSVRPYGELVAVRIGEQHGAVRTRRKAPGPQRHQPADLRRLVAADRGEVEAIRAAGVTVTLV